MPAFPRTVQGALMTVAVTVAVIAVITRIPQLASFAGLPTAPRG